MPKTVISTLNFLHIYLVIRFLIIFRSAVGFPRPWTSFSCRSVPSSAFVWNRPDSFIRETEEPRLLAMQTPYIYEYSEKSIAVFGDTKPFKSEFSSIGGRFNPSLRKDGVVTPGWVFKKTSEQDVLRVLRKGGVAVNFEPRVEAPAAVSTTSTALDASEVVKSETPAAGEAKDEVPGGAMGDSRSNTDRSQPVSTEPLQMVEYSDRAVAVYGDSSHLAGAWKVLGGKFNKFLKHEGSTRVGWILPSKHRATISALVEADATWRRRQEAREKRFGGEGETRGGAVAGSKRKAASAEEDIDDAAQDWLDDSE
jgi:hypothetical protein